tara:strand:- start:45676 stop:47871 length:2196 start_codon:yes stop_codon:yes gene_type:complete
MATLGSNDGANLYVSYNGLVMGPLNDPSGLCPNGKCSIPTPYVTRSDKWEYVGTKSYRVTELSIAGKIYSDSVGSNEFNEIDTKRNSIFTAFNQDYGSLVAGRWTFDYVKVNNINFSEGNTGVIDFNISLTSYENFFNDVGVLEPKNEYSFTEQEDGVIVCRHKISAKGARLGSDHSDPNSDGVYNENDPIARAKAWCESLVGYNPGITSPTGLAAKFSSTDSDGASLTPFSVSHSYDRITGTYSIEETFKQGLYSDAGYVETYDISEKVSVADDYATIQINYTIKGPPGKSINTVRSHVPSATEFYNKINNTNNYGFVYDDFYQAGDIDPTPISYEASESKDEASINVSISFNQLKIPTTVADGLISYTYNVGNFQGVGTNYYYDSGTQGYAYLDYEVTLSTDEIKQLTTVDIRATMKSKGSASTRRSRINNWYNSICDNSGCNKYIDYDPLNSSWTEEGEAESCAIGKFLCALAAREYFTTTTFANNATNTTITDNWNQGSSVPAPGLSSTRKDNAGLSPRLVKFSNLWYLNPMWNNLSIQKNSENGEIEMTATFDNRDIRYVSNTMIRNVDPQSSSLLSNQDYYFWKDLSYDISQDCAMNVLSLKAGMNGNSTFHDYLIFDHNTLTKESTTFNIKGSLDDYYHNSTFLPYNAGYGYTRLTNVMLGMYFNSLKNVLQSPKNNSSDYIGLESNDSSRTQANKDASHGISNNFSKTVKTSQTVTSPFVTQI